MGVFRDGMEQEMVLRGFADKTRKAYRSWVYRLVKFSRVVPDQTTNEHVRAFLLHLTQERRVAFSTFNQALHSIRFFFKDVLKREHLFEDFHYQRREKTLPSVLSCHEVRCLLKATPNLRDRALLELAYSAGLRLGEVVRLKISDIDSARMVIRVEQAKGRKD